MQTFSLYIADLLSCSSDQCLALSVIIAFNIAGLSLLAVAALLAKISLTIWKN